MDDTAVEAIFTEFDSIQEAIGLHRPSDLADHDRQYRKVAILSCASFLEAYFLRAMTAYFVARGTASGEFTRRHALERKFHTWFDFKKSLPDPFFKAFGDDTFSSYKSALEADAGFQQSAYDFMSLLSARNMLIHNNLAEQSSSMTFQEVRLAYRSARKFIPQCFDIIESCDRPQH